MEILFLEVWKGASHGIGHQLRPSVLGVRRQASSSAVLKYYGRINRYDQEMLEGDPMEKKANYPDDGRKRFGKMRSQRRSTGGLRYA